MPDHVSFLGWVTLLSPLIATALILLLGIHRRRLSAGLAVGGLLLSFLCAGRLFLDALSHRLVLPAEVALSWIAVPGLAVPFGVLIGRSRGIGLHARLTGRHGVDVWLSLGLRSGVAVVHHVRDITAEAKKIKPSLELAMS